MSAYIAIEGETPRPLEALREILPGASFPDTEMTDTDNFLDILAVTAYEPCEITNSEPTNLEYNERAELGVATRVGGALQAAWSVVSADSEDATTTLAVLKTNARNSVEEYTANSFYDVAVKFCTGNSESDPEVDLRPNPETVALVTQLVVVAQNANTGAEITDVDGDVISLTLPQLQFLLAGITELLACLTARKAVARASIESATTAAGITSAVSTYTGSGYGPGYGPATGNALGPCQPDDDPCYAP